MASRPAPTFDNLAAAPDAPFATPCRLEISVADVPARSISLSDTGLVAVCDDTLPPAGPVAVTLPGLGVRGAQLIFRSDAVGAVRFDRPLSAIEFTLLTS